MLTIVNKIYRKEVYSLSDNVENHRAILTLFYILYSIDDLVGQLYGAIEPTNAFFDDLEGKLVKELAKELPPEKPIVDHPYSWTPTSAIWLADFKNAFRRGTGGNHQHFNRDQETITNRLNDIVERLQSHH